MTEYFADENLDLVKEPATNSTACAWAEQFTKLYFSDLKAHVQIAFNTNPGFRKIAAFDPSTMTIHLSQRLSEFEELAKIALLHEMTHLKLYEQNHDADDNHGARFRAEIARLIRIGAYAALL